MSSELITINRVRTCEGLEMLLALVPPNIPSIGIGLIEEQIIGKLLDTRLGADGSPNLIPENFSRNATFVEFMHGVINHYGFRCPGMLERAKNNRPIGIVDLRCPENETPTAEDIVGVFYVENGAISSYKPNPKHRVFSSRGFFRLPPPFDSAFLHELALLINDNGQNHDA